MPIYGLSEELAFPHPLLVEPEGLLAVGGDVSPERLLLAYSQGIFPWNTEDEITHWWFLHPRMILFPQDLKIAKSMNKYFKQGQFKVSFDQNFETVIEHCRHVKRSGQDGTWLYDTLIQSMITLHHQGIAHSVEVWEDEQLVGGLYGLSIGKIFCGESMFSLKPNASKFGFISLVQKLQADGFTLIDCQQETEYLASFGAKTISKEEFYGYLESNMGERNLWR